MLYNAILLAFSASIDSLGVGITYGIKKTKISFLALLVLFFLSLLVTSLAIVLGSSISNFISADFTTNIGGLLLCCIGIFIIYGAINNKEKKSLKQISKHREYNFFIDFLGITINIIKNPINSDLDKSNIIDIKEAMFLGLALSLDSISIGFMGSTIGINSFMFPILISLFQIFFLSIGRFLGNKISNISKLPNNIWNIISGIILIIIGAIK